ncbi:AraC family transcriptional regulator [Hazenella sp. IB182357]|uniref:AraC family transcriptional regulator n=1 Tax=Polycladospora coralii TaxID=2771432 RepID=A0A926RTP7_9BACL|nr:GyrI-like domain-containing protein [Polycladospora coralii]MBD1371429.1 AraC family transcriptional regulator [Polycladospora coralii]
MNGKITTIENFKLIGLGWTGPYEAAARGDIVKVWKNFFSRLPEIAGIVEKNVYYAPFHSRKTDFTYYVGVKTEADVQVPTGLIQLAIPVQQYAMFTHQGPMSQVEQSYLQAWEWMKEQKLDKDVSVLTLERYDHRFHPIHDEAESETNEYEIYIPVQKRE